MKAKWVIITVLIMAVVAVSCTTLVFDESVPVEETCEIHIKEGLFLQKFNNVMVSNKFVQSKARISIPAGQHSLAFDYANSGIAYGISLSASDLIVNYNFVAGRKYQIYIDPPVWALSPGTRVRVAVKDVS